MKEEDMKIKVLGCSGAEIPGHRPPSFLLNGKILFDTGSLTNVLDVAGQVKIKYIFITHPHLDHILGIPFLADNLIFRKKRHRVDILSIPPVIKAIRESLLDGMIWPDFTVIPNTHEGILNLIELKSGHSIKIDDYTIIPYPVHHSIPATGYLVEDRRKRRFFYTGDTGPSDATWREIGEKEIHCLLIEASFPNRMEEIAIRTGHLTPRLLKKELLKIKLRPERILVTHVKPQYFKTNKAELQKLKIKNLRLIKDRETIQV
jgi:ribonuclease BN (tRNA processing enzyme)